MSLTTDYSRLHRTVREVARERGLQPMDVRVLLAIAERGGVARSDELEEDLRCEPAMIRRSMMAIRPGLVTGGDKRGCRVPIALTADGQRVVDRVRVRLVV